MSTNNMRIPSSLKAGVSSARQPGARGSRQCWCIGKILEVLGQYGWILPLDDVDAVLAKKTDGKIYLDMQDSAKGVELVEGDTVGFYLYSDDMGLAAEGVRCLEKADPIAATFNAKATEFVASPAMVAKPVQSVWVKKESGSYKGRFYYVNSETRETSWKIPEDYSDAAAEVKIESLESAACIQNEFLAYLSDDSSDEESDYEQSHSFAVGKAASQRSLSPEASTAAGLSSDSDTDDTFAFRQAIRHSPGLKSLPEAVLGGQKFRPPPGLSLPLQPCTLALGILARSGLSAGKKQQQQQQQQQQQKWMPRWRRGNVMAIPNQGLA